MPAFLSVTMSSSLGPGHSIRPTVANWPTDAIGNRGGVDVALDTLDWADALCSCRSDGGRLFSITGPSAFHREGGATTSMSGGRWAAAGLRGWGTWYSPAPDVGRDGVRGAVRGSWACGGKDVTAGSGTPTWCHETAMGARAAGSGG